MAHLLTTRARAEQSQRERLLSVPAKPQTVYSDTISDGLRTVALRLLGGILALALLGTALWRSDEPSHPLRLEESAPVGHSTWYTSDSAE
ncbi:MAG: hypothetical protein ACRYG7_41070 [Janthinobacterium lividum]